MTTGTERGFTIIEVMLFLAITGALFAALMLGVSNGITQQRYLDSVRSYKALLQNQYSEVLNTRNEEAVNDWRCSDIKDGSVVQGGSRGTRGTSSCVILGRAIQISDNGKKVTTSSVTGYDANQQDSSDDIAVFHSYQPKLSSFDSQSVEIDWEAQLVSSTTSQGQRSASTAVILILRSPATGLIQVFTSNAPLNNLIDLADMINVTNASATAVVKNCVEGNSGLLPKQSISIDPRIASPDAVTIQDGDEVCQ